ncbi:MAG: hypothetical protein ABI761_11340 [Saprospiraceae bacterium]
MDDIGKLISIYNQAKISKKLRLFDPEENDHISLYRDMFNLIERKAVKNETELITKLYGNNPVTISAFKKVKERLKNKLINIILLVDLKEAGLSDRFAAYSEVIKLLLIGRVLISSNEQKLGEVIMDDAMKMSFKYDFLDLQHILSKLLASQYGSLSQDSKKYIHYSTIASTSLQELLVESQLRQANNEYFAMRFKSLTNINSDKTNYSNFINLSLDAIGKSKNSEIRNFAYGLLLNCYIYTKNKSEYEVISRQSLKFFLSEKKIANNTFKKLSADIINGCLLLRLFTFSDEIYASYAQYFNKKEHNWYVFSYYRVITNLHEKKYDTAYQLMKSTVEAPDFKKQFESMQQHFRVLQAYFYFLQLNSKISKTPESVFRIKKFLNEVPMFSKEKRGMNISILAVQILVLIIQKRMDEVMDRIDSLSLYSYRYLRKSELWRTSCFIKMLSQLSKYNFNKKWAKSRIQPYYEKLISVDIGEFPGSVEIEIIPYEDLWQMILEKID